MDGVINIRVNGYSIVKDHNCAGAQFESGSCKLVIAFDEVWEPFVKTVTFWDALGENPTKIVLGSVHETGVSATYRVPIPGEVLTQAGMIAFTIDGYAGGVIKRTVEGELKVLPSRKADEAEEPAEPTPTPTEQLQMELKILRQDMSEADQAVREETMETLTAELSKVHQDIGALETELGDTAKRIPAKVSQLENDSGFLLEEKDPTVPKWAKEPTKPTYTADEVGAIGQEEADSKTETITLSYGNLTDFEIWELDSGITKTIYPEKGDIQYIIEFTNKPMITLPVELYTVDDECFSFSGDSQYVITLSDYDDKGGVARIDVWDREQNKVSITKVKDQKGVLAEVKEGSIQSKHLSEEVLQKMQGDTTITKYQVDDTIITEDDIASTDKAGIVQISPFGGLFYGVAAGGIAVDGAIPSDIDRKAHIYKPVAVEYMDYAIAAGTHQEMSDDYDVSAFDTGSDMDGDQGKLPVSYDAVKNYVDSIAGDIETALDNIIALQGQY